MKPVVAAAGVAARTGIALIAGACDVVEIGAARPLQEIAADRRGVAKLRGRSGQQRLGDRRKAPGEIAVVREVGVADQRADPHAAVGKVLDAVEAGKVADVDEAARAGDAALHQVEKVGAGGQIGGARFRSGRDGFSDRRRPDIVERLHATFLRLAARKRLLRLQHRLGDSLIGAAAAEISAHAFAHALRIVAGLTFLDQTDRAHDLAGRAEPALQAVMGDKGLLHRMKPVALRHAFDREDVGAVVTDREREARIDPASVDDDRAGAALAAVAALLGSGQIQAFAKKIEERDPRVVQLRSFS